MLLSVFVIYGVASRARRWSWAIPVVLALLVCASRGQTFDPAFSPSPNAELYTVAAQPDGRILIGGNFSAIGNVARSRIARLNADGSVDPSFNASVNTTVRVIAVQPDGNVLVGGSFNLAGNLPRNRIARFNAIGAVDEVFNPNLNNSISALAVQADGKIIIGGAFTNVGGTARTGLARLNADGTLDPGFEVSLAGALTVTPNMIEAITLQPDGRILIAGNFNTVAGQIRRGVARLLSSGILDLTFVPPAFSSNSRGVFVLPDGKLIVHGNFARLTDDTQPFLVRLNPDGSHDPAFSPPFINGVAWSIVQEPGGKLILSGAFSTVGGIPRNSVVRLNTDHSLDSTFDAEISGTLIGTSGSYVTGVVLPPGPPQILVVGNFSSSRGQVRNGIVRFGTPLATLTRQPASVFAQAGSTATLSVAAEGTNLRYQWRRNGADIPNATNASHSIIDLQNGSAGIYTVAVTNPYGSITTAPATVALGAPLEPTYAVSTFAGAAGQTGRVDGATGAARFDHPTGLALDSAGNVYTIDTVSNFVRKITSAGVVTTLASHRGQGIAVDRLGNIYVADGVSDIVRITPAGTLSSFAGNGVQGTADGPAGTAHFRAPTGLAVDAAGNVYVADTGNLTIRRISPAGIVSTIAGVAGAPGSVNGPAASARFNGPRGLAFDAAGNLFVADGNRVRKVSTDGNVTSIGITGDAAGVAVDSAGNVYATDFLSNVIHRFAPSATSLTMGLAGAGGASDGPVATARFNGPWGIAVDRAGVLYVADNGNSTIRKITPDFLPLAITVPLAATHAEAGSRAALTVGASGANLSYQWKKDGSVLPGATAGAFILMNPTAADMGFYSVAVTSEGSTIESTTSVLTVTNPASPGRLINVATRGFVPAGGTLTPGFVLRGNGNKQLVVRGVGPTLLRFGLGSSLTDPRMEIAPLGGAPTLTNDDWSSASPALATLTVAVGGFPLDNGSKDSAAIAILRSTMTSAYTVRVTAHDGNASGLALAEVYDADALDSPVQLANVSTRGFVGTGANALVPGFVIGGGGPLQLLIRAVGPGLTPFGVTGVLTDPQITVVPLGGGTSIAANDNWGGDATLRSAFAAAGAFGLPLDSRDAAVLVRLPPGGYTVVVSGVGNTIGAALVEIYDVP